MLLLLLFCLFLAQFCIATAAPPPKTESKAEQNKDKAPPLPPSPPKTITAATTKRIKHGSLTSLHVDVSEVSGVGLMMTSQGSSCHH